MNRVIRVTLLLLLGFGVSGQHAWASWQGRAHCDLNAAYVAGVNDARHDKDMRRNYARRCFEHKNRLNEQYRRGYLAALKTGPQTRRNNTSGYQCHTKFGEKTCGYDCKSFAGQWKCAPSPGMRCMEKYGEIKCGYNCQDKYGELTCDAGKARPKSNYQCHTDMSGHKSCGYNCKSFIDRWVCAPEPGMQCLQFLDDIKCGYNCRKEFTTIVCDD